MSSYSRRTSPDLSSHDIGADSDEAGVDGSIGGGSDSMGGSIGVGSGKELAKVVFE